MSSTPQKKVRKEASTSPAGPNPLIFISHDSRDAELAEAFAKLLSSVSTGFLKSFRSSDIKTREGLDYGVEWFSQIETSLRSATDVICLLTDRSLARPWILYEAGFARGNAQTPVFGLAVGIPLSKAITGPFALLQNCSEDSDSLSKLLRQLLRRLPGAEPQEDALRSGVEQFKRSVNEIRKRVLGEPSTLEKAAPDVGKLFEEIKAMFYDVSSEVKSRALDVYEAETLVRQASGRDYDPIGIAILSSALPPPLYWLQDLSLDLYRRLDREDLANPEKELLRLKYLLDISEPHFGSNPNRRQALQHFGRFLLFLADSYSKHGERAKTLTTSLSGDHDSEA